MIETRKRRQKHKTDLSSSVHDLTGVFDAVVDYALGERSLDGREVRFDEMILDELLHKRRLSCSHSASHLLGCRVPKT